MENELEKGQDQKQEHQLRGCGSSPSEKWPTFEIRQQEKILRK